MIRNPFTPQSQLWPSYEYRIFGRPNFCFDVVELYRQYGKAPVMTVVKKPCTSFDYALYHAVDLAREKSLSDPRNPNPVLVYGLNGKCAAAYVAGAPVGCPQKNPRPMIRNPFTSPRAGWPRYEYRVMRTTLNRWSYYKATFLPGMTTPSEMKAYPGQYYHKEDARDSACDDARVMSQYEIANDLPPNPNPVIVYGFDSRPECAYIAGSSISWDELEEMGYGPYFKNPSTPPAQFWPGYSYRIKKSRSASTALRYDVWLLEKRYGEQCRQTYVDTDTTEWLASRIAMGHAQQKSAADPRNPNAIVVFSTRGICVTAYLAGQQVGCSNPQPRTIVLNPEEYEWVEWAIDGMRDCMDDEDYEEFGYQPESIPPLKRMGARAWIEVENLNALEDLLYRLENQARAMVDYEIKQFTQNGLPVPAHLKAQKSAQLSLARKLRKAFDEMSVS